ncbi:MAG: hypothetical protein LBK96_07135, partial [Prevotellaceae bacterium]|nr:hypothetical protein [Prevotellaceae bacterium]
MKTNALIEKSGTGTDCLNHRNHINHRNHSSDCLNHSRISRKSVILLLLLCLFIGNVQATVRYVKAGASGTGASWANASGNLQAMINASASGDQVWVAA